MYTQIEGRDDLGRLGLREAPGVGAGHEVAPGIKGGAILAGQGHGREGPAVGRRRLGQHLRGEPQRGGPALPVHLAPREHAVPEAQAELQEQAAGRARQRAGRAPGVAVLEDVGDADPLALQGQAPRGERVQAQRVPVVQEARAQVGEVPAALVRVLSNSNSTISSSLSLLLLLLSLSLVVQSIVSRADDGVQVPGELQLRLVGVHRGAGAQDEVQERVHEDQRDVPGWLARPGARPPAEDGGHAAGHGRDAVGRRPGQERHAAKGRAGHPAQAEARGGRAGGGGRVGRGGVAPAAAASASSPSGGGGGRGRSRRAAARSQAAAQLAARAREEPAEALGGRPDALDGLRGGLADAAPQAAHEAS